MEFLGKKLNAPARSARGMRAQQSGQAGEDQALAYLQVQGLQLLARNYRAPGRGGGEIDLILRDAQGTVVFVEVRSRGHADFGGAGASINRAKQRRIVQAAQYWLLQHGVQTFCRFDAVLIDAGQLQWLQGVFDAA